MRDLETKQNYHCNVFICIPSESCLDRPIYNPGRLDTAEKCNISGPDPATLSAMMSCNQEMEKTKGLTAGEDRLKKESFVASK